MTLDKILLNEQVLICSIHGDSFMRRRLLDLGFIPGMFVKCVLVSPFRDPRAYQVAGNVIALRNIDAKNVEVSYENN